MSAKMRERLFVTKKISKESPSREKRARVFLHSPFDVAVATAAAVAAVAAVAAAAIAAVAAVAAAAM